MNKPCKTSLVMLVMTAGVALTASGILVDPSSADWQWVDPDTNPDPSELGLSNPITDDIEVITGADCELTLLYNCDIGECEEGPCQDLFTTDCTLDYLIWNSFEITWDGGQDPPSVKYLLVKDGSHVPRWYLFDVSNWNLTAEPLQGAGFWPDILPDANGEIPISHLGLYGCVPDGGAMIALLGLSVLGLSTVRRYFFQ